MTIKNVSQTPRRFFGLHFVGGVAQYRDPAFNNGEPYTILVSEEALHNLDKTFEGKPVFVDHVEEVDLQNLQEKADGYVVKSFFNDADGKHWVEFIVVSDRGHEAIRAGWKLSNAYVPVGPGKGSGEWHGVPYDKEITDGVYEHLAIVQNPRYAESVILTPEEFRAYNERKKEDLRLSNSKDEKPKGDSSMLKFFKKQKVENGADLEEMSVILPKSGKEVSLSQIINSMDSAELAKGKPVMANGDEIVKVGNEEYTVKELAEKYSQFQEEKKLNEQKEEEEKKENESEEDKKENESHCDKKENGDEEEKKENESEEEEKKMNSFKALKNAHLKNESTVLELSEDKVARGKSRYGSNA